VPAELGADFGEGSHLAVTEFAVEGDRRLVGKRDDGDDAVHLGTSEPIDQCCQQARPEPTARDGVVEDHRRVDRAAVPDFWYTDLADWQPIYETPGCDFVNLQYGSVSNEMWLRLIVWL